MSTFNTSLMREKFVIQSNDNKEEPIIALSNRIVVHLISEDKIDDETFVIRTQNMHSCCRLAAAVTKEFYERGSIINRGQPLSWSLLWADVIKGYEKDWNSDIWCVVYHKGREIYKHGEHHPFLDIIEQCDAANKQEYKKSIKFAEDAFSQAGKAVKIEHDSNVALVVSSTPKQAKCGVIVRAATGATTFNYTAQASQNMDKPIQAHTTLTVSAAFLEGIQLAFQVGLLNRKKEFKLFEKYSDEEKKHKRSVNRLSNLDRAINNYEQNFSVNYRPDRPDFKSMVQKSEKLAMKILKPEIEAKLETGEINSKEWII